MADEQPGLVLSFLRHGETELSTHGLVLRGRLDDPLTVQGEQQMHTAIDTALPKQSLTSAVNNGEKHLVDFIRQPDGKSLGILGQVT